MNDLFRRLRSSLGWVAAQFWVTLLLISRAWHGHACPTNMRGRWGSRCLSRSCCLPRLCCLKPEPCASSSHDEQRSRAVVAWRAHAVGLGRDRWAAWALLDWCDDQIPEWAGYLNSRVRRNERATFFTYDHIQSWLTILEWVFRWIVVPAKVIP